MNQTNQEYTAIIAYKIGILALIVSVIFLTFSFLGVGFTTNDDMQHWIKCWSYCWG